MRSHEERRWLFEGPTQSRMSPSMLQYTKRDTRTGEFVSADGVEEAAFERGAASGRAELKDTGCRVWKRQEPRAWLQPSIAAIFSLITTHLEYTAGKY